MLYFDNAATTLTKPPGVAQAISDALCSFGGVGRGVHPASLAAGRAVYETRSQIAQLFEAPSASSVAFTMNATMALNIAIQGLLKPGNVALTTAASHNSVLRPLFRLRDEAGCTVRIAPINPDGSLDMQAYQACLDAGDVALVVATHASNVTGDVYDVAEMARRAHEAGALFVLDAAQTAGMLPLSMKNLDVDVMCFTGHKSLMGPQGTGGLCVAQSVDVPPLLEGGSGVHSFDERHPRCMSEALEAGTVNAHGIAGLHAALSFLEEMGVDQVYRHVSDVTKRFVQGVAALPGVHMVGGQSQQRCGIVALQLENIDSSMLADVLAQRYEVCTRAGAHCAPLMHKSLGTHDNGVVRFSFSCFTSLEQIDEGLQALEKAIDAIRS